MGGGASLMAPVFSTPEASIGFHMDCDFYMLFRLPGKLGEYLDLTGARLNGKELVAAGVATHFVPLVVSLMDKFLLFQTQSTKQDFISWMRKHIIFLKSFTCNCPGIRFNWNIYRDDHQNRVFQNNIKM